MPRTKFIAALRRCATSPLSVPTFSGHASKRVLGPTEYASHKMTCELPARPTHDCYLKQFTALESQHRLPKRRSGD